MLNPKPSSSWFFAIVICLICSPSYSQTGAGNLSGATTSNSAASRATQAVGVQSQGASSQMTREGVSGPIKPQQKGLNAATEILDKEATPASTANEGSNNPMPPNNGNNNLEWGVFGLTQSDMGNPIFTDTGKIVKRPNFFGSGFEIVCNGKILIPMVLPPQFQVDGLEVLVCHEPVAYSGGGAGPTVVDVKGIRVDNNNANP